MRFAFLEQTAHTLDATVVTQSRELSRLKSEYDRLRSEMSQIRVGLADDVRDEPPPPHY